MLAARSSTRGAQRFARSFASVVDAGGLKVASVDAGQPTASVTVLVKAGSRFETKPGVAHALKNFAFKSTAQRSALGTVRESELYGGLLSSSISREHIAFTAEFLRGDEQYFVDVLSSFLTSAKFTRHEFEEYVKPVVESESHFANEDAATRAVEIAHALAFRSGLGSSVFAPAHGHFTAADIKEYAQSVFTKDNIAVLGTGISQDALSALVSKSLASIATSSSSTSAKSGYFGGETRVEAETDKQTVFIGFGSTGAPSAETATLAAYLSPSPSVKWGESTSPISKGVPTGASVQAVYLPYSDASLFGLLVQGETSAQVTEAGKAAVAALQEAAKGLKSEDVAKAVAKAKFASASAVEGRDGLVNVLGAKVLEGVESSAEASLAAINKVSSSSFNAAVAGLVKSKPTFVAVGDIRTLPHPDELGV